MVRRENPGADPLEMGTMTPTYRLPGVLAGTENLLPTPDQLVALLESLPSGRLPLQDACSRGGIVDESTRTIGLAGTGMQGDRNAIDIEVFFNEVVGGCNCHDEPSEFPCRARLRVQRGQDSELLVSVLPED